MEGGQGAVSVIDSKQRLRIWIRLLKLSRRIDSELRERLRVEFGTTLPRFDVLAALFRAPDGLKMTELSQALMVSNGNVTGIIERLVQDGLVKRVPVEGDRRAMIVRLTEKGRQNFAHMAEIHERWIGSLMGPIDNNDADRLYDLLGKIMEDKRLKA